MTTGRIITTMILIMMPLMGSVGCRQEKKQPAAALTKAQSDVAGVLGGSESDAEQVVSLSQSLHDIADNYTAITGDTSIGSDALLQGVIDSAVLWLSSRTFMVTDAEKIAGEINDLLFVKWGLTFNPDRNRIDYLLPQSVLQKKQGSCIGMSLLLLLIAEKTGIPLYGVLAPGHFYVRYDDGVTQRNFETLRRGEDMPTAWYREKYSITDTVLYDMKKLSVTEVIAVVKYTIGTLLFSEKKYAAALVYLGSSVESFPSFAEAQGNYALVLDATAQSEKALSILLELQSKKPSLPQLGQNIASLQLRCNDVAGALATYEKLCVNEPYNSRFLYGKGVALHRLKRDEEAVSALRAAVASGPEVSKEALLLLKQIETME